ncbi:MAG: IS4 family transposase, partial [Armatimonadetes bacterium]|nr:IS4 family transposase [Armatimonadota bacterium]
DFRAVSEVAVKNSAGLAFFMGNLSAYLLGSLRERFPDAGVSDLKSYYRGRRYVAEVLKCLPHFAEAIVCSQVMERVSRLGCIHSSQKHAAMTSE